MISKSVSNKYPLVPSVQFRRSPLGPMALIPALPVQLGGKTGPQLYATIESSAKISVISEKTLHELDRNAVQRTSRQVDADAGSGEIVAIPLLLCDPEFAPWIDLGEVPFVVLKAPALTEAENRILLGFDSCLSGLRIDIDYPRNVLTVHAPARGVGRDAVIFPAGIREGEALIALGSYGAAVAIIAATLERVLVSLLGDTGTVKNWNALMERAEREGAIGAESSAQLKRIWQLRNLAVHEPSMANISKGDVQSVLRAAKKIITTLILKPRQKR